MLEEEKEKVKRFYQNHPEMIQKRRTSKIRLRRKSKPRTITKRQPTKKEKKGFTKDYLEFVKTTAYLQTPEHHRWRYKIFQLYKAMCMNCQATKVSLHADHIKPRKYYPELAQNIDNGQILCYRCNKAKGNNDETDFRNTGQYLKKAT